MPILSKEELIRVTGKKQNSPQRQELLKMKIFFIVRSDGSNIVSRNHFEEVMGGSIISVKQKKKMNIPNFDAIK